MKSAKKQLVSTTWKATYIIFDGFPKICYQIITGVSNESAARARFTSITDLSDTVIKTIRPI